MRGEHGLGAPAGSRWSPMWEAGDREWRRRRRPPVWSSPRPPTTASRSRACPRSSAPTSSRSSIASSAASRAASPTRPATSATTTPPDPGPDLFAQIQAEAATTWRSPATTTSDVVRGTDRLRAWSEGFSLHAGAVIADHDREALERLARYGARPAFAHDRLTWTSDGRISCQLKRPWPDGRTHLVTEPRPRHLRAGAPEVERQDRDHRRPASSTTAPAPPGRSRSPPPGRSPPSWSPAPPPPRAPPCWSPPLPHEWSAELVATAAARMVRRAGRHRCCTDGPPRWSPPLLHGWSASPRGEMVAAAALGEPPRFALGEPPWARSRACSELATAAGTAIAAERVEAPTLLGHELRAGTASAAATAIGEGSTAPAGRGPLVTHPAAPRSGATLGAEPSHRRRLGAAPARLRARQRRDPLRSAAVPLHLAAFRCAPMRSMRHLPT